MLETRNDLKARVESLSPRQRELLERMLAERAAKSSRIPPRPHDLELVPTSFGQERIWFMDKFIPYRSAFCVPSAVRLRGHLNTTALEWSLNQIVDRHEVLRTVLVEHEGAPAQKILEKVEIDLEIDDLRAMDDPEAAARQRAAAESERLFDLSQAPLLHARLLRLADDDHVLVITLHHIVSDAWTLGNFYSELESLYASRLGLEAKPLPELPIQFADFAYWQRQWLQGEQQERLLSYWREHLAGAPAVIELPTDHPRPAQRSTMGKFYPVRFERTLIDNVRSFGQQEGATLHMTLLAAFTTILARYARQEDIVIGVPIAGRGRSEVQPLIGFFLNWLVLRIHVGDDPTFRELLGRVRQAAVGGYAHQDLPFEVMVQALAPRRDLGSTPLFQVSFSVQDTPYRLPQLAGLHMEQFQFDGGASHYDLMADLWLEDGDIVGNFPYNDEIFEEQTIARIAGHMRAILEVASAFPDVPISLLPMHSEETRERLLNMWDRIEPLPESRCLHQIFEDQVSRSPDAVAVTYEDQNLTYDQLNRHANKIAHLLRGLGVGPESVVAICTERTAEMVTAILGVLKAGGAYLPINPDYPRDRIEYMLSDAHAMVLLAQEDLEHRLPEARPQTIWLDSERERIDEYPDTNLPTLATPENIAYIIYTSGSTGKSKGVLVTHGHVARLFSSTQHWFNFGADDVWTLFHSYAFDFSVWELWGPLLHGGRLVVVPYWITRAPDAFLELLAEQRVTVLNQTPSAFAQLQRVAIETPDLNLALRYVIFGGEALELQSLRPWFERFGDQQPRLINMYGITETTVHVTYRPIGWDDLRRGLGSVIGQPIPDLDVYILDQHMEPVPIGVPGELYVGGAGVARGYLNRAELTATRFVPNPYSDQPGAVLYRTGDLARFLTEGEMVYLGRIDDQVKIRGHRIELGEIQTALVQQPKVQAAVVMARDVQPGEKRLIAYVVTKPDQRPTVTELRRSLQAQLPDYMVPSSFVFLEALPLTVNGKVDRRALPDPSSQRPDLERAYVEPRTEEEAIIAEILAQVLKVERVGAQDNFFDLGGHSLAAVQVISRIRQQTGVELTITSIFKQPTVEGLAAQVASAKAISASDLETHTANADAMVSSLSDQEVEALLNKTLQARSV